jgi:AraC-like DNA-binding protein
MGLRPIAGIARCPYFVHMKSNFAQDGAQTENHNGDFTREGADLIESLSSSRIYQDYEKAFSETTGLPVSLRPVESWQLPHRGKRYENPFCGMMAQKSRACAACLRLQQQLSDNGQNEAQTLTCELGLCDTVVPIRQGERLVGFLQTGQIFRKKPTEKQFNRTAQLVSDWGLQIEKDQLKQAYFGTKVLSNKQHDGVVKLLSIFAQHISMVSNQILVQRKNTEPVAITRAKQFIQENQAEDLSLGQVAKAVNTSTFYFCKMFKKATGLNFTDYVSRVRVEKAKNLLLNRNLRVSEIAYEVGFQSLTHFNRVFKKIMGQSPTEYRAQLVAA